MEEDKEKLLELDLIEDEKESVDLCLHKYKEEEEVLKKRLSEYIQEVKDLADDIDEFHKGATIASVAGSAAGIAGGITSIIGLILIPFTFGASTIVTGVGIGVATAGGITSGGASLADSINIKNKRSKAQEMITQIDTSIENFKKRSEEIDKLCQHFKKRLNIDDLKNAAKVTGRVGFVTLEIFRLARLSAIAARGAQIASQVSGVLAGIFLPVDTFFFVKGVKDLLKGSKTDEAGKIRQAVDDLSKYLSELEKNEEELTKECEKAQSQSSTENLTN